MQVSYDLDDPVFTSKTREELEQEIRAFLSKKKLDLPIAQTGDQVVVDYPEVIDIDADEDERIVLSFCRDHRFGKAKKVVRELLEKRPWDSEGHRLLAQIEMETGETEIAIDHAKDAVRLNPRNLYALTLLGNLLSRDKHCIDEGIRFTRRAYELYPDSAMAVNNYAGSLMQMKDADRETLDKLFREAIQIDPTYMNPYYGLAQGYIERGDTKGLFETILSGLRKGTDRPENTVRLRELMTQIVIRSAHELLKDDNGGLVESIRKDVEVKGGVQIHIEEDPSLSVPAKMELSDNYKREWHRLVFNSSKMNGTRSYYLAHELEKLLMRAEAEKAGRNARLASSLANRQRFIDKTRYLMTDRFRSAMSSGEETEVLGHLMDGVGGQLMNCPLDIFVGRRLFEKYPQLRPAMVAATFELAGGSVNSVRSGVKYGFPKNVVRINRTLNAVTFLANKDLFGIDFLSQLEAPDDELKMARRLYDVYVKTTERFAPGDEWNVVRAFAENLHCDEYFQIIDAAMDRAEQRRQEESTRTFQENFSSGNNPGVNMAVTMYMVEAIKRLNSLPVESVRQIAAEIAVIGMGGISPDRKSGYTVTALGGEDMGGCRLLAYYFVSWKIAFPDKVSALGLPFDSEYAQAVELGKAGL